MSGRSLSRLMVLERPENAADGGGGEVRTWRGVAAHWATACAVSATEAVVAGGEASRVTHRIALRWSPVGSAMRPTPRDRLREGARVFNIVGVAEADDDNRFLTCWAVEGMA